MGDRYAEYKKEYADDAVRRYLRECFHMDRKYKTNNIELVSNRIIPKLLDKEVLISDHEYFKGVISTSKDARLHEIEFMFGNLAFFYKEIMDIFIEEDRLNNEIEIPDK